MKQKTPIQNKINSDIKRINKKTNVFSYQDFKTNEDAKELEEIYSFNHIEELEKLKHNGTNIEQLVMEMAYHMEVMRLKKYELLQKVTNTNLDEDQLEQILDYDSLQEISNQEQDIKATAEFFGIPNKHLDNIEFITQIADPIYYEVINATDKVHEITIPIDGQEVTSTFKYDMEKVNYYKESINNWVQYCKRINSYKAYIVEKYPRWDKSTSKQKKELISTFKKLLQAPFISDKSNLEEFIYFIENYTLNQTTKAKAKKLLDYEFKNVDNIEIAKEICNKSNLKFNI